ncbi:hypothetical protein H5410_028090 [Solanum commersonii]|uniref:Uncharacterized protein n=1 Tax=Solanum commersonii TaxID=4109 RepID=A0A9J5Z6G5_SOLCO|nr:hypothetical protein H5410_028090 [Solanum commersonii]
MDITLILSVLYVIYVVINMFIGMVVQNLIPFPQTPYCDSSVICDVGRVMKWRIQNKRLIV